DDLTLPGLNGNVSFYKNTFDGFQEVNYLSLSSIVLSVVWVDYDNDGDADISLTEEDGLFRLFRNNGQFNFQEVDLNISENIPTDNYGISWADYDKDGFLDFYICRYVDNAFGQETVTNLLIKNNGDGTFEDVTIQAAVGNGYQQSFSSTWADFNKDGNIDLYVVNDRTISPNVLFLNNADGTFTDASVSSNSDVAVFAMTSTIGDMDNDRDLDIYVTNGSPGNHLLKNTNNGIFEDLFPNSGAEIFQTCWGANWVDYDNNGWKDLYVCSSFPGPSTNSLLVNDGTGALTASAEIIPMNTENSYSVSKGDYNNDGFYDLLVLNTAPSNSLLLKNTGNDLNSFLKISLEGTVSNKDAIGTEVTVFSGGNSYFDTQFSGTNFCSQDSQRFIVGVGNAIQIDSVQVLWPSGIQETHYNLAINSSIKLIEGSTFHASIQLFDGLELCPGEITQLGVSIEADSVIWSTNTNSISLEVSEPGTYYATAYSNGGIAISTDTVNIIPSESPLIQEIITTNISCNGLENGQVTIEYLLPENEDSFYYTISNINSGYFNQPLLIDNLCTTQIEYTILEPAPLFTDINTRSLPCDSNDIGSITLTSFGGSSPYTYSAMNLDSIVAGNNILVTTDNNNCTLETPFYLELAPEFEYSLDITDQWEGDFGSVELISISGELQITQLLDENNTEIAETELTAGAYTITISNEYGCEAQDVFNVDFISSINDLSIGSLLEIHPNPFIDQLIILKQKTISKVLIFSLSGTIVHQQYFNPTENFILDLSHLATATYVLHVSTSELTRKFRIIKM
ncbi:MAG: FG-GAP-like repeat-containing protein, partial [Flavobacteriales bacterium]